VLIELSLFWGKGGLQLGRHASEAVSLFEECFCSLIGEQHGALDVERE